MSFTLFPAVVMVGVRFWFGGYVPRIAVLHGHLVDVTVFTVSALMSVTANPEHEQLAAVATDFKTLGADPIRIGSVARSAMRWSSAPETRCGCRASYGRSRFQGRTADDWHQSQRLATGNDGKGHAAGRLFNIDGGQCSTVGSGS